MFIHKMNSHKPNGKTLQHGVLSITSLFFIYESHSSLCQISTGQLRNYQFHNILCIRVGEFVITRFVSPFQFDVLRIQVATEYQR